MLVVILLNGRKNAMFGVLVLLRRLRSRLTSCLARMWSTNAWEEKQMCRKKRKKRCASGDSGGETATNGKKRQEMQERQRDTDSANMQQCHNCGMGTMRKRDGQRADKQINSVLLCSHPLIGERKAVCVLGVLAFAFIAPHVNLN